MQRKVRVLRNIAGTALIIIGAMGLWWKHPLPAAAILLLGICLLPALYKLLPIQHKALPILLPLCCVSIFALLLLTLPKADTVTSAFPQEAKDTTYCYVTASGSRYHFTRTCAGKNTLRIKTRAAIARGYAPCSTCCKDK